MLEEHAFFDTSNFCINSKRAKKILYFSLLWGYQCTLVECLRGTKPAEASALTFQQSDDQEHNVAKLILSFYACKLSNTIER